MLRGTAGFALVVGLLGVATATANAQTAYVANVGDATPGVSFFDTGMQPPVVAGINLDGGARDVAITPDGRPPT